MLLALGPAFWAGCFGARFFQVGPWPWLLAAAGIGLFFLARRRGRRGFVGAMLTAAALGLLWTAPRLVPATPAPGVYGEIRGYVYGEPRLRADRRETFVLGDVTLDGVPWEGKAYCSLHYETETPPELFDGAALSFRGRVYVPEGKSGAPRFDLRQWMLRGGLSFGVTISQEVSLLNSRETAPVKDRADRLRRSFQAALESVMGEEASVAAAMLFNLREGVSEEEYASFQRLGIAHLLSVSGLHVGLLASALLPLLRRLRLGSRGETIAMAAFLALYCGATGFSAAALRASVTFLIYRLGSCWNRRADPLNAVGAAMLAVLLLKPLDAGSAGYVLSFSAAGAMTLLAPGWTRFAERLWPEPSWAETGRSLGGRIIRALHRGKRSLCYALAAQAGVLLPCALFFHSLPLYGIVLNVLLVPLAGALIPLYAATLLLCRLPVLGPLAGFAASALTRALLWTVELLARLPYASLRVASPSVPWLVAGYLALGTLSLRFRVPPLRRLAALVLTACLATAASALNRPPETRYIQLAVGQADAALLFAGEKTVAFDVGADGSAVIDYLAAEGRDLDAVFLTHLHLDHAGGLGPILDAGIEIRRVYLPVNAENQRLGPDSLAILERIRQEGIPVEHLARGDSLRYNEVEVTAEWPEPDCRRMQDANELPLVLRVEWGGFTLLNASDLTGDYENYVALPCDVLKAAHHGSRESGGEAFLEAASPSLALISCSSSSRSLPGAETLERLRRLNVPYFRTDESGDVLLWAENDRLYASPYRQRPRSEETP